jgi:sugar lactone lactonase YvrE/enterochelin esterase-like enzyme
MRRLNVVRRTRLVFCVVVVSINIVVTTQAFAQPAPPYRSPVVDADRRVTFRIRAPGAEKVRLTGALSKLVANTRKDDSGLWHITTKPVAPEIYGYAFSVDGVRTLDAQNPWLKFWKTSDNLVEVPSDPPTPYADRDVPHGSIHVVRYRSKSLGDVARRMHVYTPPGYEDESIQRYPVLYLLHGFGDDDSMWTALGRANFTLDNAIADKRCVPMIVVMPYGHASFADRSAPAGDRAASRSRNLLAVSADILGDVVPLVESRYRTKKGAHHRAIVGLSMGGGQSLHLGLNHPDTFAWVGAFSSAVYANGFAEGFPLVAKEPENLDAKLRWLWIGCGRDDFLFQTDRKFSAWLDEKGVGHRFEITAGGHSWSVWRGNYLPRVVPLLFREGSKLRRERLYRGLDSEKYLGEARVIAEVADEEVFTEGPAVDRAGRLFFTNIPVSKILRHDPGSVTLSIVSEKSHKTNGLLFDPQGRLLACEGEAGRVTRTDMKTGEVEVLAGSYNGFPFAAPNDLCLDHSGRIYFTSRPGTKDATKGNVNAVYRIDPDGKVTQLLAWPRIHMPNGIVISPDGKTLYLIEAHPDAEHHRDIRAFDLRADGSLANERVLIDFYPGRSGDGMCIDAKGNLYVAAGLHATRGTSESLETRPGIHVISPEGKLLAWCETPEDTVTNCTFGGDDLRTLYVTCGTKIVAIRTAIPGLGSYRPKE